MLDLADVLADPKADELAAAKARVRKMAAAVATFAPGCGLGAAGFMFAPATAFVIPAILAGVALFASTAGAEANQRTLRQRTQIDYIPLEQKEIIRWTSVVKPVDWRA